MTSKPAKPIWSKRTQTDPAAARRALLYCAGRDVAARPAADAELIPYDIWTNRAHCTMLAARGIIPKATLDKILKALARLEREWAEGAFALDPELEDVHINVERFVAQAAGEAVAGVMHTARSRNDQSATDMRLWLRDRLLEQCAALAELIKTLAKLAGQHAGTLAPGWTHGQPAMPTTLGHWLAGHAWALQRDAQALEALWPYFMQCPLGAAASFGTSWPIDREMTAKLLAFDGPQPNSLDCISTRGEAEARLGAALAMMMTHLSSLGQDLIFLTTPPRDALRLPDSHVTGSSIMPNKRNPDFAEVTRARALAVHGLAGQLAGVGRGALSGYNRDTQWTKYWVMDLVWEVGEAPAVFREALDGLKADKTKLAGMALEGHSLAADFADHIARTRGLPFRRAYHVVAEAVAEDEAERWLRLETVNAILKREKIKPLFDETELARCGDAGEALKRRASLGGPAPEDVKSQAGELSAKAAMTEKFARAAQRRIAAARAK